MKRVNRSWIVGLCVLGAVVGSVSAEAIFSTSVEPIVGYERVQKLIPEPRSRDRLVYGVRATAGMDYIAAEAEYTRADDVESFPETLTTVRETDDRIRLGVRSTYRLGSVISVFLRAGAQARQTQRELTVGTETTRSTDPIQYNPYAGAGLRTRLGRQISFTADVTTVFRNFPSFDDNDYMVTAGFVVSFP